MAKLFDGFWLPKKLRDQLISEDMSWIVKYQVGGKPSNAEDPQSVGARWPLFSKDQWQLLFNHLEQQRTEIPDNYIGRFQSVLASLFQQFQQPNHPFTQEAVNIFSAYTGYSPEMVQLMMSMFDETSFNAIDEILKIKFPSSVQDQFISLQELNGPEGYIRFFPANTSFKFRFIPSKQHNTLPFQAETPQLVLGYASGNVLGTAFIITLLGKISALVKTDQIDEQNNLSPAILVKNSRQEPIFVPFLFTVIEKIDPGLLASVAIMIWDYEDAALQELIISKANLVLAAAGDPTIQQIGQVIKRVRPGTRFHQHGHKTSFTTIGKSYLTKGENPTQPTSADVLEEVTLLAALDSILWDQNGCLSSRIHFIEQGTASDYTPLDYGLMLVNKLRLLSKKLPRGMIPLSRIHDRFEYFNAQASSPQVKLCSTYDDDFIVFLDERPWNQQQFHSMVNTCMERTIVIRPIESIMDVPNKYLALIPPKNLQTMYVAIEGETSNRMSPEFSHFIDKIGARGITSIRAIGQSPFPQLAYSWDGYLPQNLALNYPAGYFTTIEFENNYQRIQHHKKWLADHLIDPPV